MLPFFFRPTIKIYGINFDMIFLSALARFAWDRWTRLNYTTWSPCITYRVDFILWSQDSLKSFVIRSAPHNFLPLNSTLHTVQHIGHEWINARWERSCCVVIRRIREKIIYNLNICITVICLTSPSVACSLYRSFDDRRMNELSHFS